MVAARIWEEEGMGNQCLKDTVSVCDDEKVLGIDSGDGFRTIWMDVLNVSKLYTYK